MPGDLAVVVPIWRSDEEKWKYLGQPGGEEASTGAGIYAFPSPIAEQVYDQVWRTDFTAPGFCLLDARPEVDSHTLRSWMVELKEWLSQIHVHRTGTAFAFRSMGRFDQQETTKFHLDGAPDQSLLMLGYEPSRVRSRLFLADYSRAAFDLGMTPKQFLKDFNSMYRRGEDQLARYVTELPQPQQGYSRIVLIDNSSLPFEERRNPLGVLHKAIIDGPDESKQRIVNSAMMVPGAGDEISTEQQREFVETDRISLKFY